MNIFAVDESPILAAQTLCDRHVVKMILESAQMLSTAHRVLDGTLTKQPSKSGKRIVNAYVLEDREFDEHLYRVAHVNHPCSIWCRETSMNYQWLFAHFQELGFEYTRRYNRAHKSIVLPRDRLSQLPKNIKIGSLSPFALAMPDEYKQSNQIAAYRAYYRSKKNQFDMTWKNNKIPSWFEI